MATNFIQEGKDLYVATGTGLDAGDPFVYGDYLPCVLLTDAETASPYNATVRTHGVFDLSVEGTNASGDSAVAIGDSIFWQLNDTPPLSKDATGDMFGIALETVESGATTTIQVRLHSSYLAPEGIVTADIADLQITNAKIANDTIKQTKNNRRFIFEEFESAPICMQNDGTAASGTNGETNLMHTEENAFEYFIIGTQDLLVPTISADGLLCSLDLVDNDGVEYSNGITVKSRAAFTAGTDAFYGKCTLKVADIAGSDFLAFGFRKAAQAYQDDWADYTDKCSLNKAADGDIEIITALNNLGDSTTDTTDNWANGETHTLEVYVDAARAVTYKIDGAPPTVTAALTLDNTDVFVPFLHIYQNAAAAAIHVTAWEVGLQ